MTTKPYDRAVRRAALPEVMFVEDVAIALLVQPDAARRAVLRGDCGPYFRLGRRMAVLRESFLAALAKREEAHCDPQRDDPSTLRHLRGYVR